MADFQLPADANDGLIGGRYRFLSSLGQGGMGTTSRYWDVVEGRPVVVKQPRREFLLKPGFLERFDREVRLMRSLPHTHIVPVIDAGTHQGLPYIVMPFLPGGSLSVRRLRDADGRPLANPPSMLHLWLPGIAAALDHMHAHGVVHRDVKPANIFFDAFWHASLGDFGVAKIVDESGGFDREETLTGTNVAIGTEFYMAPELYTPKAAVSGPVDQYALAVVVYEMLCGRRPFTGEMNNLIVEVLTQSVPPLDRQQPGLPAGLVQAVHRGLAKRADERFPSATAFAEAVLAEVPPMANEPGVARIACPTCSHLIKVAASDGGRRGQCPKCRKRLKIADDLCALWTRDEEAIVAGQPPASWPGGDLEPAEPAMEQEQDRGDVGPVFKPLSEPTLLARQKRMTERQRIQIAIGLAILNAMAIAIVVWFFGDDIRKSFFPYPDYKLETDGWTTDGGRLEAFSPVGWKRVESTLDNALVIYKPIQKKTWPKIRVLREADPRPTSSQRNGGKDNLTTRECSKEVDGRKYIVEVTALVKEAEDAEKLAELVADGLKKPPPKQNVPQGETGLTAKYFKDRNLKESTGKSTVFHDIYIDWSAGPPAPLPRSNYSVCWTGFIIPRQGGAHTFSGVRDDGLRLTINEQVIVDEWKNGGGEYVSRPINLRKGESYPIKIEFFNGNGPGRLTLNWKEPIGQPELVPSECLRPGP